MIDDWQLPSLAFLERDEAHESASTAQQAGTIVHTLASFGIPVTVTAIHDGPRVTQFCLSLGPGIRISQVKRLADDLALALAVPSIRIQAPLPNESAIGIEVPKPRPASVRLRSVLRDDMDGLSVGLGEDLAGQPVTANLVEMPHLLIAGTTGSGKSVCIHSIITSLLTHASPDDVEFVLIDPKRVELSSYAQLPHLLGNVTTSPTEAVEVLSEVLAEVDTRYVQLAAAGVRNVEQYNARFPDDVYPYWVVVIDELADLMLAAPKQIETLLCRLAQLGRAAGVHIVAATQRPSVDVITGLIKANFPARIALAVNSAVNSRVILDESGAEKLLGRGDMLYLPSNAGAPVRLQGAYVSDQEIDKIVRFWQIQNMEREQETQPLPQPKRSWFEQVRGWVTA